MRLDNKTFLVARVGFALTAVVLALCIGFANAAETISPPAKMRRTLLENFRLLSEFEISKEDLLDTRRHLINVRRVVGRDFAFFPKQRIDVYLSDTDTFRAYTSMPRHVSGLFDGRIHIPLPALAKDEKALQSVLWHEYTHAVVYALSGGRCPPWLNEGLAVYQESKVLPQDMTPLRNAVAASGGELPIPPEEMDAAISTVDDEAEAVRARVAYQQASVLAGHLFSRYSRANIRDLLIAMGRGSSPEEAFREVLRLEPDDLKKRWVERLKKIL